MGDMGEIFRAQRDLDKQRKKRNLESANPDGWNKHTEWHWYRFLDGCKLDYWPSRNKFQYKGRLMTGDVAGFIKNRDINPIEGR